MSPSLAQPSLSRNSQSQSSQPLIFSQHGWSDTGYLLGTMVRAIAPKESEVVAPSLDYWQTWLRIEPLIRQKEAIVAAKLAQNPNQPLRVVAHSMGGLIWTELLHRHPEWWTRLESFVMVGSPIGGSDIARMIDPFGWGIGIARDLGVNRRALAEEIAATIPTLVIASDIGGGTDGIVTVECTKVTGAEFVLLPNIQHATQRTHIQVGQGIQAFWQRVMTQPRAASQTGESHPNARVKAAIASLRAVPGMTDATYRDLVHSRIRFELGDDVTLRTWRNPTGLSHVFLADAEGRCLYAGYVGWFHDKRLQQVILALQTSAP